MSGEHPVVSKDEWIAQERARIQEAQAAKHRDALADTHHAYTQFHGYELRCLWCDFVTREPTKAKALANMQDHYDRVIPEGAGEIR